MFRMTFITDGNEQTIAINPDQITWLEPRSDSPDVTTVHFVGEGVQRLVLSISVDELIQEIKEYYNV
jgi:hypothetical protein